LGFFFTQTKAKDKGLKGLSSDFLRKHSCSVCPLDKARNLQSPKMGMSGSKTPTILICGEMPTAQDDQKGQHFTGKSGRLLTKRIPKEWENEIGYTSSVQCHTPNNKNPDKVVLSCCSPRLEKEIVLTKPKAIFGLGHVSMMQLVKPDSKYSRVDLWRGRRLPIEVGGHRTWYYPMFDPLDIVQAKGYGKRFVNGCGSDNEFAFALDLERAFAEVENLPEPVIHTVEEATANVEIVYDIGRIAHLLSVVANDPSTGVDLETNCLRPYTAGAKILSAAFSSKSVTFAFPIDHSQATWTKLERKQLDVLIKRFLYEAQCRKIVHHLPFELEWFGYFYGVGCFYAGRWDDSESQAYLLDARRGSLSLDFLCLQYFGIKLKEI
jgi:uracil-DNA glycosylase family 4